jgi:hypothetical protein
MKEIDPASVPRLNMTRFVNDSWITLQNLVTLYLIVFVIGMHSLTGMGNKANIYAQYYIIEMTNFEAGVNVMACATAVSLALWIFKNYLINYNWRYLQILSVVASSSLGLLWILVYYNIDGLQNPWFSVFIDLKLVSQT